MAKVMKVKLSSLDKEDTFSYLLCQCSFCEKRLQIHESDYLRNLKLGHGKFYCSFCIRNKYMQKQKTNIMIMDFRGIIGYYINELLPIHEIYQTEIIDLCKKHAEIGQNCPVLNYDPESLCWFIDFNRIGKTKHKVSIDELKETIHAIIHEFEIQKYEKRIELYKLIKKYDEAIDTFYESRKRPEGKRILSPTLKDCGIWSKPKYAINGNAKIEWEETKYFSIFDLVDSKYAVTNPIANKQLYTEDLTEPAIATLPVTIIQHKDGWSGEMTLQGFASTKLRAKNGHMKFKSKSSLGAIARAIALRLGLTLDLKYQSLKKT